MKVAKLFLVGAIALGLGLTACNNEVENFTDKPEATVSVKIVQDANPGTRATGDLTDPGVKPNGLGAESDVKKTQVWVFAGSTLDGYGASEVATPKEVLDIPVHTGARDIYIVVNGPAGLGAATTKTELEAATQSLPVNDIATTGLTMTAEKISKTIVGGKNTIGYGATSPTQTSLGDDPVKVVRINARVAIASAVLNLSDEAQAIFNQLKDVQVAMFNVQKTAKIFDPSTTSGNWMYGELWPSPQGNYEQGAGTSELAAAFKEGPFTLPIVITNAPYFYVNPMATADKMFIVLRGKPHMNDDPVVAEGLYTDADGYTYYPVWINQKIEGTTITSENGAIIENGKVYRNTQYNIYLTIKNIGNPTIDEPTAALLDVKVEVEPWLVVSQTIEW
ncbi:MAG: fimbria major subunit [Bacteroidota bacterium]|nr:fimbria major subunit [Bacteroidota bacterium]